ncbi:MAG: hypothetical protein K0R39_5055 [Symbiobacteriaceae bacterium]|jgi:hypothetical protein|nr:hypothetical protein [Symbiobacteriaceae bacterium]
MMAKSIWQRAALAATGILLLGALAGCAAAGAAAVTAPPKAQTKAPPKAGFTDTKTVENLQVTLMADPYKVGENKFMVDLNQTDVKTVEAQIIMQSMGHGQVLDLVQTSPGHWEASSKVIDMVGPWMIRVQAVTAADAELTATFMTQVKE